MMLRDVIQGLAATPAKLKVHCVEEERGCSRVQALQELATNKSNKQNPPDLV
jgi:hypothetical protein